MSKCSSQELRQNLADNPSTKRRCDVLVQLQTQKQHSSRLIYQSQKSRYVTSRPVLQTDPLPLNSISRILAQKLLEPLALQLSGLAHAADGQTDSTACRLSLYIAALEDN